MRYWAIKNDLKNFTRITKKILPTRSLIIQQDQMMNVIFIHMSSWITTVGSGIKKYTIRSFPSLWVSHLLTVTPGLCYALTM